MRSPIHASNEELIPWKGEDYDSDLYDMVELDVSGSEGSSEPGGNHTPRDARSNFKENCSTSGKRSETSSGVSSWIGQARSGSKDDVTKPLNELHIDDDIRNYPRGNSPESRYLSPGLRRKLNYSPLSSASSAPSTSPTPRRVRDDDSWISRRSVHR